MNEAKQAEPPAWSRPPLFMIGQDDHGNWVVQDLKGNCGGLFVNREAALRYVRFENGHRPQAVVMVGSSRTRYDAQAGRVAARGFRRRFRALAPDRMRRCDECSWHREILAEPEGGDV